MKFGMDEQKKGNNEEDLESIKYVDENN